MFLLATGIVFLSLGVVLADDAGKTCPYDGEKSQAVLDTVNSEEFQNKLSNFALLFLNEIPSTDFFFKLFDVSFDPRTVERTFFLNCVYYGVNTGLKCPINLCKDMAKNVAGAFKNNITSPDYFIVIANTLEDSLKEEGKLKAMNSSATREKIKTFINDVAEYLCKPEVKGPVEALFALDDGGGIKYFKSLGVSSKKDVSFIAKKFGNEFAKVGQPAAPTTKPPDVLEIRLKFLGINTVLRLL